MEKTSFREKFLRVAATLGLVAVIVIGAWGIIQIAFNLSGVLGGIGSWAQSIFSRTPVAKESIVLSLPNLTTSGEPLAVSWTHANQGDGAFAYTIVYSCTTGLTVKAAVPNGTLQDVPCNTPFNYTNATSAMTLTPTVAGTKQATSTISVSAIALSTGTVTVVDSKSITILPARAAAAPAAGPVKPVVKPATPKTPYSNPQGLPDLSVTISSVTPVGAGSYAVSFVIQNIGTKVTPYGWTFEASLPYDGGSIYPYVSKAQRALYPNEKIAYTLNLSLPPTPTPYYNNTNGCTQQYQAAAAQYQPYPNQYGYTNQTYYPQTYYQPQNCYTYHNYTSTIYGGGTVRIHVDPLGVIVESNKLNNTAISSVPGSYNY